MRKSIEQIKKELQERIEEKEALLQAWENVERLTKKDGSDFSVLSKNFKNATVKEKEFSLTPSKKIQVYAQTKSFKYVNDDIETVELVKYSKIQPEAERIIKEPCLEAYFFLTVSELFDKIAERIETIKQQIISYERQFKNAGLYYYQIVSKMEEIGDLLDRVSEKPNGNALYLRYQLEDVVKNYYFN